MQFHAFHRTRSLCKLVYTTQDLAQNLYDPRLTLEGVSLLMKVQNWNLSILIIPKSQT